MEPMEEAEMNPTACKQLQCMAVGWLEQYTMYCKWL